MKMYSLSCKDLDMFPDCDYVATAESREEVMKMAEEHFEKSHPKEMKEMREKMSQDEIEQKMMENITESSDDGEDEIEEEVS